MEYIISMDYFLFYQMDVAEQEVAYYCILAYRLKALSNTVYFCKSSISLQQSNYTMYHMALHLPSYSLFDLLFIFIAIVYGYIITVKRRQ